MIMKKSIILSAVAIVLLISACEKEVTIKVPQKDPSLVLIALPEKGDLITASVGRSRHILEPRPGFDLREHYAVKNAQVVVFENGVSIDTLTYHPTEYLYKSGRGRVIRQGYTYSVKINAPDFKEVTGETIVPSQSEIAEVRWEKDVRTNSYGESVDEVFIKLNDPAAEKNFYLIKVFQATYPGYTPFAVGCVSTTDKDIETIGYEEDPAETERCLDGDNLLMKDLNFDGGQKQLKLSIVSSQLQTINGPSGETYRPYIKVYRITEDQFRFAKSYNVFDNTEDNPFAEPVNVYSNIKNGYGILAASTVAVDTLR
jgi:hypothetical protein